MKLVFDHIDFTTVGHLQSVLEAEGIRTEIRNLNNSGLAGAVPIAQTFPELWVLEDSDEDRARAFIENYRNAEAQPVAPNWTCANCGESVEGNFAECWNCGTPCPTSV